MKKAIFIILFIVCSFEVVNCQEEELCHPLVNGIYNITQGFESCYKLITLKHNVNTHMEMFDNTVHFYDTYYREVKPFYLNCVFPMYSRYISCLGDGYCITVDGNAYNLSFNVYNLFAEGFICSFNTRLIKYEDSPGKDLSLTTKLYIILGFVSFVLFFLLIYLGVKKCLKNNKELNGQYEQLKE